MEKHEIRYLVELVAYLTDVLKRPPGITLRRATDLHCEWSNDDGNQSMTIDVLDGKKVALTVWVSSSSDDDLYRIVGWVAIHHVRDGWSIPLTIEYDGAHALRIEKISEQDS